MVGSIGLLPSPTPISGRTPCCPARLPRTGHTYDPIPVATQVLRWHTLPRPGNTRFPHTCSVSSCWSACASLCPSRRQGATVATLSSTHEDSTEQHAHGQGEFANVPPPSNAHLRGYSVRQEPGCCSTHSCVT